MDKMARRASSSAHPLWLIGAALLVAAAVGGGFLIRSQSDPFRTISSLPVRDYLEHSNSLRGNVYKLDGIVSKSIDWSDTEGRLFAVEAGNDVLAVLVPPEFRATNIEKGQRFVFKLEVGDKGILRVKEVRKS
jgi:hypothetical protein